MKKEIKEKAEEYAEYKDADLARTAFVVFKSMEGQARLLNSYSKKHMLQSGVKSLQFGNNHLTV